MSKKNKHILDKNIKIGIIGLGYVGLPLANEFSRFFKTVGYDKNKNRINELKNNFDRTREINKKDLENSKIVYADNSKMISNCNVYIVTVPTPINKINEPDLSPLESASILIANFINKGDIVIYESTVYPGATEDFCVPIIEKYSKLIYNKDFFCGYSPERINPGDKNHTLKKIVKVTSGSNKETADFVDYLYKKIIAAGTYKVSSIAVAEAAKVIENTQRDVNIALMNELSIIFGKLKIDTLEVLEAAGTKWNFLPFRPGLVGGHCIGVDPYYLMYKAIKIGYSPEVITAGRRINDKMGAFIVESMILKLAKNLKNIQNLRIAIFGLTFKENCPDLRNSKVFDIIENLKQYNCKIIITDSWADSKESKEVFNLNLVNVSSIKNVDVAILAVAHDEFRNITAENWEQILSNEGLLMDIKSLYSNKMFKNSSVNHWRL